MNEKKRGKGALAALLILTLVLGGGALVTSFMLGMEFNWHSVNRDSGSKTDAALSSDVTDSGMAPRDRDRKIKELELELSREKEKTIEANSRAKDAENQLLAQSIVQGAANSSSSSSSAQGSDASSASSSAATSGAGASDASSSASGDGSSSALTSSGGASVSGSGDASNNTSPSDSNATSSETSPTASSKRFFVNTAVKLHAEADSDSPTITVLRYGVEGEYFEISESFQSVHVKTDDGTEGWAHKGCLDLK